MNAQFFIILSVLLIIIFRDEISGKARKTELASDKYPIKYPDQPMFATYISIIKEIEDCKGNEDLKKAYIEIIIFQGSYPDSASFTSELVDAYHIKEVNIKSHIH